MDQAAPDALEAIRTFVDDFKASSSSAWSVDEVYSAVLHLWEEYGLPSTDPQALALGNALLNDSVSFAAVVPLLDQFVARLDAIERNREEWEDLF